ncbi:MAG: acyl-CoA-binding protein [Roseiarcus sp.]|jgi:acyl-CoA-binding protein
MKSLEQRFDEVVAKIRSLPSDGPAQPSNELKLELYGLFRQARDGDAPDEGPSAFDFVGKFKHGAWRGVKGMAKDEAMRRYVAAVEDFARRNGVEI